MNSTTRTRRAQAQLKMDYPEAGDVVEAITPLLARVRSGEWRLMVIGPRDGRERDQAAMFTSRILDLADAMQGRS